MLLIQYHHPCCIAQALLEMRALNKLAGNPMIHHQPTVTSHHWRCPSANLDTLPRLLRHRQQMGILHPGQRRWIGLRLLKREMGDPEALAAVSHAWRYNEMHCAISLRNPIGGAMDQRQPLAAMCISDHIREKQTILVAIAVKIDRQPGAKCNKPRRCQVKRSREIASATRGPKSV